jgi:hypothetical protein
MPEVAVNRPPRTMRPIEMPIVARLMENLGARPPRRRLEPPVPQAVEVEPVHVETASAEPVRVATVLPVAQTTTDPVLPPAPIQAATTHEESPLIEALRCFQNKTPEQAVQHLRQADRTSRELLVNLLPLAVRLADGDLTKADPQDLAALIEQVQGLLLPLRERAALEIPKLCFCRPVATPGRGGVYELLDDNHLFRPGEMVALYLEVRNFTCAAQGDDYRTHVATAVEIRDERGQAVYRFEINDKADSSLSPRQDFSNGLRFPLPSLPSGAYTLELKATDVPSGRMTKRSLDFRVTTVPARGI